MSLYRPKNSPYYHYDFQMKGVRYHGSTHCAAKRDAERFERDLRTEIASGKREKPSITLDEGAGLYWGDKGQFDKAAKTTEYQLGNLIRLIGGRMPIHEIDDLTLSRFVAVRRSERVKNRGAKKPRGKGAKSLPPPPPVSSATVNREVELLKRVIRFLSARYRVGEIEWTKHKLRESEERVREASEEEEAALFKTLRESDNDLADLVEFALLSGARKNALVTLIWSKVDFKRGTASVYTKGGVWHTFPLTQRMLEILANRPRAGAHVFTYVCKRASPRRGDRVGRLKGERYPYSAQGWDRQWRRALADSGIKDFRFHDLRHTTATRLVRDSGNLKAAQKLLGHTRIETTARYAHVTDADLLATMENAQQSRNSPEVIDTSVSENGGKPRLRRVK
ncbi:integrase [Novosphingobium sp. SG751A]|uniref:site-specific integrase n=1 Tax=Novosphingobium sp. SG751A TaxID=2587000 RepID=UPI0015529C72|nr:site-specific integrase [Novosphingobium sp. SG751A]NOW44127.1 integrase [Novosphingobium sp. SG751A]